MTKMTVILDQNERLKFASKKPVKSSSYPNPNLEVTLTPIRSQPNLNLKLP